MKRCGMCKRWLLPDWLAHRYIPSPIFHIVGDGRLNCGGDCLRCVADCEHWLETGSPSA